VFQEYGSQLIGVAVSTGAACGRSRPEAMLKGLCEVVERDAYIIMWRNRLPRPRVKIDPRSNIYNLFNEKFARPGLEYILVYTTLDLSLPSFFGILIDRRRNPPSLIVGGAASLNPDAAVLKTLLELVQGLKWMDSFEGQSFPVEPEFQNIRSFQDRVKLYALNHHPEAFSFLLEGEDVIELSSISSLDTGNLHDNLQLCYGLIGEQDMEILASDLTTVDLEACGLYVTKVLIPQCQPMEGDHRAQFLGGERWHDVPVRMGFRTAHTSIETVNPWPHPYP
jgi:ribosomal protein S12 methylthiotransferase accessory factor